MRPVRLTMQAFGPYPGRVAVDFRDAVDAGLFGIYGQTGSGKSTIFSAMTFALFGEPAKSEQDAPSLRSDHADAGMLTEVEFVFDIGPRRFVIVRHPEQMRPKQKGTGETKVPHEGFLFDATGLALDEITAAHRGKIIAEKKVGLVDDAIAEMLGYGADQFRQIVLLPQGRFETFLAAKTKDRLEILRDLFDVSLYRDLAARLKADAANAENHVRGERDVCARRLTAEGFESTDALAAGIVEANTRHTEHLEIENAAHQALEVAQIALRDAEAIEVKFKAAETTASALAALEAGKSAADALAERVAKAERARSLLDAEARVTEAASEISKLEEELRSAQGNAEKAANAAKLANEALQHETGRAGEIQDLRRRVEELDRHKQTLEKASDTTDAVEKAQAAERKARADSDNAQQSLTSLEKTRREKSEALKASRATETRRNEIGVRLAALQTSFTAAEAFEKAAKEIISANADAEQLRSAHEAAQHRAEEAQAKFDDAEQRLSASQALHLAAKLESGAPCPVCGATEHPAPATRALENVESDQTFRDTKAAWQQADKTARDVAEKLAAARSILTDRETRQASMQRPSDSAAVLSGKVRNEQQALDGLGPQIDLVRAESEIEGLDGEFMGRVMKRDALRDAYSECQKETSVARARLEEMLSAVPVPLRDQAALATTRETASQALTKREAAKTAAEKQASETRDAALTAQKDQQAADNALNSCRERQQKAVGAFKSRLVETELSEDDFCSLKPAIATIDIDRATIEQHNHKLAIAEDAAEKAAAAIREQVRPDLESHTAKQREAEKDLTAATDQRSSTRSKLEQLTKLRDELADTLRRLDEAEAASGPLRNLAELLNGENAQKLDLETFAIGAMFDQVLEAANLRIGPMTNNRYRLERDLEGGRGRRGLGIQVFDTHTGKARPTSTLSGGETFIAALALALGLADVVESASGKIRLDTIFIDEGFGSLDTENGAGTLDQVLQVLSKLVSQNRSVGIISHVPLVQEAIPNGFYVRKDITGSTVESRGVI